MWGAMLRALTLVLYCTGMRLGEATRLHLIDVDLRTAVMTVQRSKGRSRILAIRDDLVVELRQYLRQREEVLAASGAEDPLTLFIRRDGSALTLPAASDALRCLLRDLGLKPKRGRSGARPYELRHAFAVHRLTAWAVEGVDVHAKLPLLSAYLGHQNVLGTEVYLKATPELLQLASQRFEQHSRNKRRLP
jgi:integrase/recombinase XerD